jgi:diguanylate cyclase (GGDEF)-like protein
LLSTRQTIKSHRNGQLLVVSLTLFMLFLLIVTWGVVALQINSNQRNAIKSAQSDMQAIAEAYQQHILRTLRNYDSMTKFLKYEYESHGGNLNLANIIAQGVLTGPSVVLVTVLDEHGDIVVSSHPGKVQGVNLSDREHFKVHAESSDLDFFIGKPVIGRVSGQETVQMTRRLEYPNGGFAGVIVVSEKPSVFTEFFNATYLGTHGYLMLQGTDGVYRSLRISNATLPTIRTVAEPGKSKYLSPEEVLTPEGQEPVELITASRPITKYDLIGTVAVRKQDVLAAANENNGRYYLWGGLVSLMILLFYGMAMALTHKLRRRQREVEHIARLDTLTGLPNRPEFQRILQDFLENNEDSKRGVGILFIDLDNFKNINDSLSHDVGDAFLAAVAGRLRAVVRQGDLVCRFGGDEFTVILPDCPSPEVAEAAAQRILKILQDPYVVSSKRLTTGASIGISLYPRDGTNGNELIRRAGLAMYKVKSDGKNGYRLYSEHLQDEFTSKVALEQAIAAGMENNEFFLVYQPKIDMETHHVIGLEALLRWQSPDRGLVSPADFIPLAEATGQIMQLSKIVMHAACAQIRLWHDEGLGWISTAINVSAYQFSKGDLAKEIVEVLAIHGVPPHALEIELTESLVMDNLESATQTINELKNIGVKISIDDFGTGHSSLGSLMRFSADYLKIDRSFIQNSHVEGQSTAIIRTIIALAKNYRMQVIAEGVETAAQHEMLRDLDCNIAQGYLYSKPVAASLVPGVIRRMANPGPLAGAAPQSYIPRLPRATGKYPCAPAPSWLHSRRKA